MEALETKPYPSIGGSFGIVGILIIFQFFSLPIVLILGSSEVSTLIWYAIAMGVTSFTVYKLRKQNTGNTSFHFTIPHKWSIFIIVFVAIIVDLGIASPLADFMPISDSLKEYALKGANEKSIYTFFTLVILAPFFEELIFRGIMLDGLLKRYSPLTSILLSSFLFGLVHLNLPQLVGGMVMGCFIGWVYYKSQSLVLSIIIHATTNFWAFLSRFLFSAEMQVKSSLEVYGGWENLTLIMVASGMIVFCGVCIIRKV